MKLHGSLERRLVETRDEIARLREARRVLDEQITYQQDVLSDAEVRAVVAATPLADRQRRQAEGDVRRLERERDELAARIAELTAEQDTLLERLLAEGAPPQSGRNG